MPFLQRRLKPLDGLRRKMREPLEVAAYVAADVRDECAVCSLSDVKDSRDLSSQRVGHKT